MVAALDVLGHRIAEPRQFCGDVRLVAGRAVREEMLEDQHLLADVPLDRQVAVRDRCGDVAQGRQQRTLIGRQVGSQRCRTDIHVARGHRRRQAYLEAYAGRYLARLAQPAEDRIGLERRGGIARVERHARRIDAGAEAQPVGGAEHSAVPLSQLERWRVGIRLHRRMAQQHFALPPDPASAIAGLAIGHAGELRTKRASDRAEDGFRVRQWYAADQMGSGDRGHDGRFSRLQAAPAWPMRGDGGTGLRPETQEETGCLERQVTLFAW